MHHLHTAPTSPVPLEFEGWRLDRHDLPRGRVPTQGLVRGLTKIKGATAYSSLTLSIVLVLGGEGSRYPSPFWHW